MQVAVYFGVGIHRADVAQCLVNLESDSVQALYVAASEFAAHAGKFGNRVSHRAALYRADVECSLVVQPSLRQSGYDFGGYPDGGYALFRFDACVGGAPGYLYVEAYVLGAGRCDAAWGAFAVEHDCLLAPDEREVQVSGADQPYLLLPREGDLYRPARRSVLEDRL